MPQQLKFTLYRLKKVAEKCGVMSEEDKEKSVLQKAKDDAERQALADMTPFERKQYEMANLMKETRELIKELDDITHQGKDANKGNTSLRKLQLSQRIRKSLSDLKNNMAPEALRLAKNEGGNRQKAYESLIAQMRKTDALYKERFSANLDSQTRQLLAQTNEHYANPTGHENARYQEYAQDGGESVCAGGGYQSLNAMLNPNYGDYGDEQGVEMMNMNGVLSLDGSPELNKKPMREKDKYQFAEYHNQINSSKDGGNDLSSPFFPGGNGASLPPLINPREDEEFMQFFEQTRINDQKINEALERVLQGVIGLKESALNIQRELKEQNKALEEAEVKTVDITNQLIPLNKRLKNTIKQVENDRMVCYVACFVLLLAIAGVIYYLFKK